MDDYIDTIVNENCLGLMERLPDNCIDMVITSPPYDNLRTYTGYEWSAWDVAIDLYRVLKPGGVVVWITNDATVKGSESLTSFETALYFRESGFNVHDTMIWLKPHFSNPSRNRYHQKFEYMFVFSKGKPKTFNPIADVPIKYGKPVGRSSQRHRDGSITNGTAAGSKSSHGMRGNVWLNNTVGQENFGKKVVHPAMFPASLVRDHIASWSKEGDIVLDPFIGSGTSALVARSMNRHFIGCDISSEYCEIANRRLAELQGESNND